MKIFIFIISGIAGGIIGGMGMGGGTLLIPLLTVFGGVEQRLSQGINLIAFIPMSVVALVIHAKNKLVLPKYLLTTALPAVCASVPASLLVRKMKNEVLTRSFGGFLAILGVVQLCVLLVKKYKEEKNKKNLKKSLYKCVYK